MTVPVLRRWNITLQSMSRKDASADVDFACKWQEHVKLIFTQYSSKGILNLNELALFCNGHMTGTLTFKGEKCQ